MKREKARKKKGKEWDMNDMNGFLWWCSALVPRHISACKWNGGAD